MALIPTAWLTHTGQFLPVSLREKEYTLLNKSNSFYQVGQSPNVFLSAQYFFREPEGERGVIIFAKKKL